ncbi:MAG TPA: pyridoxine 5'-phosphate synthase, partial [Candidatus Eisenbacteria bacterium]|nr:pyridoxine 5'-phosphate synthase [Candidatus Eisenbacteria bacterium]
MSCELSVNVDHVATIRQARGGVEPDPARAAELAIAGGAAGITVHLREDRRHIQDHDVRLIRAVCAALRAELNLEMALTEEMLGIACEVKPERVTLVPEKRAELTTEGGLDLTRFAADVARGGERLRAAGITLSLFLDPEPPLAAIARDVGASMVEIHTGAYSHATEGPTADPAAAERELARIELAARAFEKAGLAVHAGHGLTVRNVGALLRRYPF